MLSTLFHGLRGERARASQQFAEGRFQNPGGVTPDLQGPKLKLVGEYFRDQAAREPRVALPVQDPRDAWGQAPESGLRITWLGHSTVLVELAGLRVLTDPVFGMRASPVSFAGPKRFHPPPVPLASLGPIDVVLLSHDHFDHLCDESIRTLARTSAWFVTSLGVGARLEALGVAHERLRELDWWESANIPDGRLCFTATPAQHFSGRSLLDRNRTLWSSWVLSSDKHRVFFSGDTGLTPVFREIGAKCGPFDVTMLEVGAFHRSWGSIHLGPDNAVDAFHMLGGGLLLPVHWGTFNLALHPWQEPAEVVFERAERDGLRVAMPPPGGSFEPSRTEKPTPWWRGLR